MIIENAFTPKSIEIFPEGKLPNEIFGLVKPYVSKGRTTISINTGSCKFINEIMTLCSKYDIRCQKYAVM